MIENGLIVDAYGLAADLATGWPNWAPPEVGIAQNPGNQIRHAGA